MAAKMDYSIIILAKKFIKCLKYSEVCFKPEEILVPWCTEQKTLHI